MTHYPPGGYPTPAPAGEPRIRPGRGWYVVAGAVLLVGVVISAVLLGRLLGHVFSDVDEFSPGVATTVSMDKDESRGIYLDEAAQQGPAGTVSCQAQPVNGQAVPRIDENRSTSLDRGDVSWTSLFELEAQEAGNVQLVCDAPTEQTRLAVGPWFDAGSVLLTIGLSMTAVGVALLIAAVICIVTFLRRRRAREVQDAIGRGEAVEPG